MAVLRTSKLQPWLSYMCELSGTPAIETLRWQPRAQDIFGDADQRLRDLGTDSARTCYVRTRPRTKAPPIIKFDIKLDTLLRGDFIATVHLLTHIGLGA